MLFDGDDVIERERFFQEVYRVEKAFFSAFFVRVDLLRGFVQQRELLSRLRETQARGVVQVLVQVHERLGRERFEIIEILLREHDDGARNVRFGLHVLLVSA